MDKRPNPPVETLRNSSHPSIFISLLGLSLIIFILFLPACGSISTVSNTDFPESTSTSELVTQTSLPPDPTPTEFEGRVILIFSDSSNPEYVSSLKDRLNELAVQDGLQFQELREGVQEKLDEAVQIAVVLAPDPGITQLAQENLHTQFLAIGIENLQPTQNLSVVSTEGGRPDRLGFVAGYMAAVIADDWRVGVISLSDDTNGKSARLGFLNGSVFFCGLCRPSYPPFLQYPMYADFVSGLSQVEQQTAADVLINNAVNTVYVHPGAGDDALLVYLAQADVKIIGGGIPPAGVEDQWVATIQLDLISAVQQAWPALITGEGGFSMIAPLALSYPNNQLISPGRRRLVENLIADLMAGYIDTGVNPQTGETK